MWSYILNPRNSQKFHVNSQNGKLLLRNYIYRLLHGGSDQEYDSDREYGSDQEYDSDREYDGEQEHSGIELIHGLQFDSNSGLEGRIINDFDDSKQALHRRQEAVHHIFSDLGMHHANDSALFQQVLNPLNLLYVHGETRGMNFYLLAAASLFITSKISDPTICIFEHELVSSLKSLIHSKTELTNAQVLKRLNKNIIFVANFLKSKKYLSNNSLNKIKNNTINKCFDKLQSKFIPFTPENKLIRDIGDELSTYIEQKSNKFNNMFQYGILASIFNIIFKLTGKPEFEKKKMLKYFKEIHKGTATYIRKTETKLLKNLKKEFLDIGEKSTWDQFLSNPHNIAKKFMEILKTKINPKLNIANNNANLKEVDFKIKKYEIINSDSEKIPKKISIVNVMDTDELNTYIKQGESPLEQKSPERKPIGKKTSRGQKGKFRQGRADSEDIIKKRREAAEKAKKTKKDAKNAEKKARDEERRRRVEAIYGPSTMDDAW